MEKIKRICEHDKFIKITHQKNNEKRERRKIKTASEKYRKPL